jgi:hypothetical protein
MVDGAWEQTYVFLVFIQMDSIRSLGSGACKYVNPNLPLKCHNIGIIALSCEGKPPESSQVKQGEPK